MANLKTSQEPAAGTLNGSELVRVVQSGANAKTTTGAIAALSTGFTVPYFNNSNDLGVGLNAGAANGGTNGNRYSTYFGTNAGQVDVGNSNAYFGYDAGLNATGSFNAGFGDLAGPTDGGRNNACFGGWAQSVGDDNVAVGEYARAFGGASIAIGQSAIAQGDTSLVIGQNATDNSNNGSTVIGQNMQPTLGTGQAVIGANGSAWLQGLVNNYAQVVNANLSLDNGKDLRFNGPTDANWRIGLHTGALASFVFLSEPITISLATGSGSGEGFAVGPVSGAATLEVDNHAGLVYCASLAVATHTPAASDDVGTAGQIAWDASFFYVCIATNTWVRAALTTW